MDVARSTEIRVGIVSILSIALLIGGIMLGKGVSFDPSRKQITIRAESSGGVESGSPIVVNGVKRGQVTAVVNQNGTVLISAEIDDVSDLHADAKARVMILEITGGKKIEIIPGTPGTSFDASKEIPGTISADLSQLVATLGDVSGNAVSIVRRLDSLSGTLTELTRDGQLVSDVKTISSEGAVFVKDLRSWFAANKDPLGQSIRDLRAIASQLRTSIDRNEPKVSRLIDRLDATLTSIDGTLVRADKALGGADTLVRRLDSVIVEFRASKGLINSMIYDVQFAERFDSTLYWIRAILQDARNKGVNVNVGLGHE
ncbi:MAG: MCE family protein [Candidatus Kapabacteria bacterium]|nr:MCE family protein [Candidatus Kapabacteria bacterium]